MTAAQYRLALYAAGIPKGLPVLSEDREAARLLKIDERTARRYRTGETRVPGPVLVALNCLSRYKSEQVGGRLL